MDDVISFIVPGCTVMVVLYSWPGVRDIPWSRVRVMVLTCSGVIVMVFTGFCWDDVTSFIISGCTIIVILLVFAGS